MSKSNQVILITGGSSGIGLAIAKKFLDNGNDEITPGISKQLKLMSRLAPKFTFKQLNKQPIPKTK